MRKYFPIEVVHDFDTEKLDPSKTYLVALHPHGITAISHWLNFAAENNALPGINYRIATISQNFWVPIWRDILLGMNFIEASRTGLRDMLREGMSICLVPGGAAEALDARPGASDLVLASRIGFVELSLQTGAELIPVYSFGENEIHQQLVPNPPKSLVRTVQEFLLYFMGFSLPLVNPVPNKTPIKTVIGAPLELPHLPNPKVDELFYYHGIYVDRLRDLYQRHKPPGAAEDLNIVDRVRGKDFRRILKRLRPERPKL